MERRVPIEDIGILVLENPQITLTNGLIMKLVQKKAAVISCDKQHLPCSILQPLVGHSEQTERFSKQLNASLPLKKNIWRQTISAKIRNQARHLERRGKNGKKLLRWANEVKSGQQTMKPSLPPITGRICLILKDLLVTGAESRPITCSIMDMLFCER